jgi:hypothetical protein
MREHLIGYLLDAADDSERTAVERALREADDSAVLQAELSLLGRSLAPLQSDQDFLEPPPGLAGRTIAFVRASAADAGPKLSGDSSPVMPSSRRVWLDRAIVVATAIAACVLVVPLLSQSVSDARLLRAERNLQRASTALQGYAESHRIYPTPPGDGPLSRAGLYAPMLVSEHRLLPDDGTLVSPDSLLAQRGDFRVPSLEELEAALASSRKLRGIGQLRPGDPEPFEDMVRVMGGDYGYTLGYRSADGSLQPNRNTRRAHHPLMADAPDETDERSRNHPDGAHHVLYEDGSIRRIFGNDLHKDDHLFRNNDGKVAAGVDPEDAVIGASQDRP